MGLKERAVLKAIQALRRRNVRISRELAPDLTPESVATIQFVRPFTMTTVERIEAVIAATRYVVANDIPGDFVESGVWMGGSIMAAARTLVQLGSTDRNLYLYDTYEGLPPPGVKDAIIGSSQSADEVFAQKNANAGDRPFLEAPIEIVRTNLQRTGYPMDRVHFVKGLVEDTIPETAPEQIAFLRLDTDWYSSTKVEMDTLFPRLSPGGALIIDDYGYLEGPRQAVDEHLATFPKPVFLHRIDSAGRLVIKPTE